MTKLDVIKTLTDNGIFDLVDEILSTITTDMNAAHIANKDIASLINKVSGMRNWTQFSWKEMIDLVSQVYGFTKYLAYNDTDICADVVDQIDELHTILWNSFSNMEVWNG